MKIVITGGHHTSALPIIKKLQENSEVEIFWCGHRHSMKGNKNDTLEYQEITVLQIPFYELHAGKFYKTYDIKRLLKIPYGFFQALFYLLKIKPDVILSFGGYLAVPVVLAGWFLGVPSVTHEQTLVTGYANKLISKFAKKILVSWESSLKHFPREKAEYVGLPLREELFEVKSSEFCFNNDLPIIYITAGKTGSHLINSVVKNCLKELLSFSNIVHQVGEHSEYDDIAVLNAAYESIKSEVLGCYISRTFIFANEIGEIFSKADLFISRSGAHTTKEIETFKKPSVLIPIPWTSHNEQYKNAKHLEGLDLANILEEKDLTPDRLVEAVKVALLERKPQNPAEIGYDETPINKIVDYVYKYKKTS